MKNVVLVQFSDGTYGVRKGWIFKIYKSKYSDVFFGKKSREFEDSCRMTYLQAKRGIEDLKKSPLTDKVLEELE